MNLEIEAYEGELRKLRQALRNRNKSLWGM